VVTPVARVTLFVFEELLNDILPSKPPEPAVPNDISLLIVSISNNAWSEAF
jgi:hypothetical protein